jgi:hypothetical protein
VHTIVFWDLLIDLIVRMSGVPDWKPNQAYIALASSSMLVALMFRTQELPPLRRLSLGPGLNNMQNTLNQLSTQGVNISAVVLHTDIAFAYTLH